VKEQNDNSIIYKLTFESPESVSPGLNEDTLTVTFNITTPVFKDRLSKIYFDPELHKLRVKIPKQMIETQATLLLSNGA